MFAIEARDVRGASVGTFFDYDISGLGHSSSSASSASRTTPGSGGGGGAGGGASGGGALSSARAAAASTALAQRAAAVEQVIFKAVIMCLALLHAIATKNELPGLVAGTSEEAALAEAGVPLEELSTDEISM